MASLRRHPRSPYWQAIIYLPDGRKTNRSTGTTNKKEALLIALKFEEAANMGQQGTLVERRARKTIADIFAIANKTALETSSIKTYLQSWLKRKQIENCEATAERYSAILRHFIAYLGPKAEQDISHLNSREISAVRDQLAEKLTPSSANLMVKVIRTALNQALRDGFVDTNEASRVTLIKRLKKAKRRPFTKPEIRSLLKVADFEWRGIILCGLYTGLRISDIALLTWENLDLVNAVLTLESQKTERRMDIPIAPRLKQYFDELPAGDDPTAPLFPSVYARRIANKTSGPTSAQFRKIMVKAGLAEARTHNTTDKGRSSKRETSELSFHCLRHTATSMLKNAGVSDAVARDIIGHDSEAISRQYTHIDMAAKRKAIESLPDIL
jgi:integrase